jgi:predicted CoA-binding protein
MKIDGSDDNDNGVSDPMESDGSVNAAGGVTDFLEAKARIDAIKSFVRREGYPQAVLDRLSSVVRNIWTHQSKQMRKDATLHRFGL